MVEAYRTRQSVGLSAEDRERIVKRHAVALARYGYRPQALFWQSEAVQMTRFRVMTDVMVSELHSLLDVGCGFGDFYLWLQQQGIETAFTGVDVSPDMIFAARSRFPAARWLEGELLTLSLPETGFDVVTLSGALNEPIEQADAYAQAVIARMWSLARQQVIFNLLDGCHPEVARSPFLQGRDPERVLRWCRNHTDAVRLIDGYLPNDFTVVMEK